MVAAFDRKLFAVLLTMSTYTGLNFYDQRFDPSVYFCDKNVGWCYCKIQSFVVSQKCQSNVTLHNMIIPDTDS